MDEIQKILNLKNRMKIMMKYQAKHLFVTQSLQTYLKINRNYGKLRITRIIRKVDNSI